MKLQSNELRRERDFIINYLKLVDSLGREFNFINHYSSFTYEESIFAGPHGTLIAVDAVDYPTLLPMIGEESIKISFTRPDENNPGTLLPAITFDMPIYSLSGKSQVQGSKKLQTYSLQYISSSALSAFGKRVFKAYRGTNYSKMVQDIFEEFIQDEDNKKPIEIEKTLYEVDYCVNNERPYRAIEKICRRSISEEQNGTMYSFYEDRDKFYFISIGKMFQRPIVRNLTYEIKNIDKQESGQGHKIPDLKKDLYNVSDLFQGTNYDIIKTMGSGESVSHLISVNPIRRKIVERSFNLQDEYDNFKHIDNEKRFKQNARIFQDPKSNPMMIVSNIGNNESPYILEKDPQSKPSAFEDYKQYTQSQREQVLRHITTVSLSGDPTIKAGDVINFKLPEFLGKAGKDHPEELDRYLQGKYLVASVCHIITQTEYVTNLELLKDSFHKSIKPRDPVEEYKNIL